MDHLLNNNLKRSPHFGKCPSKDLHVPVPRTFLACFTVLIRESLLSLNTAERLFLAMRKHRKEKERKEKKKREKSGKSGSEEYLLLTSSSRSVP